MRVSTSVQLHGDLGYAYVKQKEFDHQGHYPTAYLQSVNGTNTILLVRHGYDYVAGKKTGGTSEKTKGGFLFLFCLLEERHKIHQLEHKKSLAYQIRR